MLEFKINNKQCNIIATYKINDKDYMFYKIGKIVFVANIKNGKLLKLNNQEELQQAKKIFEELRLDKHYKENFIELSNIFYNNKEYKSMYDQIEKTRHFYEQIDNDYKEVSGETKKFFDELYNNEITRLCSENNTKNKKANEIKRKLVKVGKETIIVFLVVASLIGLPKDVVFANTQEHELELNHSFLQQQMCMNINDDFFKNLLNIVIGNTNTDQIMDILNNNKNLTRDDKKFVESIKHYFKDNDKYYDMDTVKYNLENLKIVYDRYNQSKYNMPNTVNGIYDKNENQIVIFTTGRYDGSSKTKRLLLHELLHAISNGGFKQENLALTEGITEMNACEYTKTASTVYTEEQTYVRILCELIGEESVKKAYYTGNLEIIIRDLKKIAGTRDEAVKFLSLFNDQSIQRGLTYSKNKTISKDAYKSLEIINPELTNYIKFYYENKYLDSISNNRLMLAYLDSINLTNNLGNPDYDKDDIIIINSIKNYFYNKGEDLYVVYYYKTKDKQIVNYRPQLDTKRHY